jgi:hypothetical protein
MDTEIKKSPDLTPVRFDETIFAEGQSKLIDTVFEESKSVADITGEILWNGAPPKEPVESRIEWLDQVLRL